MENRKTGLVLNETVVSNISQCLPILEAKLPDLHFEVLPFLKIHVLYCSINFPKVVITRLYDHSLFNTVFETDFCYVLNSVDWNLLCDDEHVKDSFLNRAAIGRHRNGRALLGALFFQVTFIDLPLLFEFQKV